jgi:hypothetical protein
MAKLLKEKKEEVLDKKTKEKMKEEIITDFNTTIKDDIVSKVADDIKESFNEDYKNALKDDLTVEIKEDIIRQVRKEQQKISGQKSFKIFRLYIYIFILIALICYVLYRLYMTDNLNIISSKLDKALNRTTTQTVQVAPDITTTTARPLSWYIDKYGYLLNDIQITNYDYYKNGIKVDEMNIENRLSMSFNITDEVEKEDEIYTISEEAIKKSYEKIFKDTETYSPYKFTVNGLKFTYSKKTENYLAISSEDLVKDEIIYEITDVKTDDDNVVIEALVAIKRGNEVYSTLDPEVSLTKYSSKLNLSNYQNALSKNTFVFVGIGGEFKFDQLK